MGTVRKPTATSATVFLLQLQRRPSANGFDSPWVQLRFDVTSGAWGGFPCVGRRQCEFPGIFLCGEQVSYLSFGLVDERTGRFPSAHQARTLSFPLRRRGISPIEEGSYCCLFSSAGVGAGSFVRCLAVHLSISVVCANTIGQAMPDVRQF